MAMIMTLPVQETRPTQTLLFAEQGVERADRLVLQYRETREGKIEARFRLDLVAVSVDVSSREAAHVAALRQLNRRLGELLGTLSLGHGLHVDYLRDGGPSSGGIRWFIHGHAQAEDRESAATGARDLHDTLVAILALESCYRFEPTAPEADTTVGPWCYEIARRGTSLARAQRIAVGFMGQIHSNLEVLVPLPNVNGEPGTHNALALDGMASRGRVVFHVSVEPLHLTDVDVQDLDALRTALEEGKVDVSLDGAAEIFPAVTMDDLRAHATFVARWIVARHGYRVRCTVNADQALPHQLLEMMGSEIFGGARVVVSSTIAEGKPLDLVPLGSGETPVLDLRNCYLPDSASIALIPEPSQLRASGVPTDYPDVPRNLPENGLLLGYGQLGSEARAIFLPESSRNRHCYMIGATGTGKSNLLFNMMLQDMRAGRGLCLIDPHGDLYEQLLDAIPPNRVKDIVAVDLSDPEYSVGLNFLECTGKNPAMEMNFLVNEMMSIFHRLYNMAVAGGPAFEQYMRNAMLLVMDRPGESATLLDVVRVFEDDAFRKQAKAECRNPYVVSFWSNLAERAHGEHDMRNFGPYITNKINQFTHNGVIRPIIGQRHSTLNFRKFMDDGRVVLVNLSKGHLGEFDARLLGMLLLGRLFGAALSRADQPLARRRPFHVYVDEFQSMATSTVASLVSEARKYGMSLTMANQNMAQLAGGDFQEANVLEAILGNVATLMMFRVGPTDAAALESYALPTLNRTALQRLPDRHVLCRMLDAGKPIEPFVFQTALTSGIDEDERSRRRVRQRIQQIYRSHYAQKTEEVERCILAQRGV